MSLPATLAIDTVRDRLQLAVALADGTVVLHTEAAARGHAEIVMARIADLLARAGLGYPDLDRVVALSGPGSFTGLRIGLSVARGLGLALGVPVLGVPTLTALSLALPAGGAVAIDARRDQAYLQSFATPGVAETPLALVTAAEALAAIGAIAFPDPIPDIGRLARFVQAADPAAWPPDPTYVRAADAKPQVHAQVARK